MMRNYTQQRAILGEIERNPKGLQRPRQDSRIDKKRHALSLPGKEMVNSSYGSRLKNSDKQQQNKVSTTYQYSQHKQENNNDCSLYSGSVEHLPTNQDEHHDLVITSGGNDERLMTAPASPSRQREDQQAVIRQSTSRKSQSRTRPQHNYPFNSDMTIQILDPHQSNLSMSNYETNNNNRYSNSQEPQREKLQQRSFKNKKDV